MATQNDTVERILDGALIALARRGARKLSMSDVGQETGISRGTLYRYFSSKDQLLGAIAAHVENSMKNELVRSVEARPALEDRITVVLEALLGFGSNHPEALQVIVVEPEYGIQFIRRVFPDFVAVVEGLLVPALERTEVVRSGSMTCGQLSELLLRVTSSTFFIPSAESDLLPVAFAELPCLEVV
jgi:AcrR family transcriptional regulator